MVVIGDGPGGSDEMGDSLEENLPTIVLATKNFTQRYLGSGTYGNVYGAELELPTEDQNKSEISKKRKTVAIKCLKEDKHAKEGFVAEIELLTSCKHPNIVTLLGFCDEGPHMILVYEYASNGSLDTYLGSTTKSINLTWALRLKICIDIARGLNYLHNKTEDEERIIHRDIKSGNILLGVKLVAKIADFGLSRFHYANQEKETIYTNNIAGTQVYLDPEYLKTGRLKRAIDIYSFGVVLFEILSGKIANDQIYIAEDEKGIAHVARRRYEEGTINALIDPKILDEVDELSSALNKGPNQDSLNAFIEVAYRCVAETQDERPIAKEIMEELEKALSLQVGVFQKGSRNPNGSSNRKSAKMEIKKQERTEALVKKVTSPAAFYVKENTYSNVIKMKVGTSNGTQGDSTKKIVL
ncbi:probable receptor-like protein kinase At2g23200 [Rutidosis leptorrhynchoides]|uniref:probable receptor-like protein kinase At2g23200 n=1 Tax=Rutidosis leptorrhynchoides TaxID=125765 RepID=UPI003A9A11C4